MLEGTETLVRNNMVFNFLTLEVGNYGILALPWKTPLSTV